MVLCPPPTPNPGAQEFCELLFLHLPEEGNGTPPSYSCCEIRRFGICIALRSRPGTVSVTLPIFIIIFTYVAQLASSKPGSRPPLPAIPSLPTLPQPGHPPPRGTPGGSGIASLPGSPRRGQS